MQKDNILTASLIDIIFDGRNKDYGAYELRRAYASRITKALLITGIFVAMIILLSFAPGNKKATVIAHAPLKDSVKIVEVYEKKPLVHEPLRSQPAEQRSSPTVPYTQMVILEDRLVVNEPATVEELANAEPGATRSEGDLSPAIVEENPIVQGGGGTVIDQEPVIDEPVDIVEIQAKFTGNWEHFLRKNLNAQVPLDNDAPPGSYTIVIQFIVDRDGTVSDIRPLTNIGYGLEQEAVRVIRKATKWQPGIQNGHAVKSYRRQPITFQVLED